MKYLLMHRVDERRADAYAPSPERVAKIEALVGEMGGAGVLLGADGVTSSEDGAMVQATGDATVVTDGPFSEAKEVIGGYCVVEAASKAEAVEWAKKLAVAIGDVSVEVRRVFE